MAAVDLATKTRIGPYEFSDRLFEFLHESARQKKNKWMWSFYDIMGVANKRFGFDKGDLAEALTRLIRKRRLYITVYENNSGYGIAFVLGDKQNMQAEGEDKSGGSTAGIA